LENHPGAVRALAERGSLWGNDAATLERARDPLALTSALAARGFAVPESRTDPPAGSEVGRSWLLKPRASGGGHGVARWTGSARDRARLARRSYLQEHVDGVTGSVVFVADGARCVPLAVTRQIVGDRAFGGDGFRYCGSLLSRDDDVPLATATALAAAVTAEFGLVGVNCIDFVARGAVPLAVEVNPRWSSSMELVERAYGVPVFAAHARACSERALPDFDLAAARRPMRPFAKAIVYARRDVEVGDTSRWLADPDLRDVPSEGERIPAGRPICTVLAEGRDATRCHDALVERAGRVHAALGDGQRALEVA
jgi:predicted ATP-grasp superfamily ATP-dependent carboligase